METLSNIVQGLSFPVLIGLGAGLRLIIGMRQFNRRGLGGLQHFGNYFVGLITLVVEWVLKWIAYSMIFWGIWQCFFL